MDKPDAISRVRQVGATMTWGIMMGKLRLFFAASLAALVWTGAASAQPSSASWARRTTWSDYLGGPDSSHYSGLKQINTGNVSQLKLAWRFPAGDHLPYTFSPLVVGNIAYLDAENGSLIAVNASTGKQLWIHRFTTPGGSPSFFSGIMGLRGITFWQSKDKKDQRLIVESNGFLDEINAQTGKLVDSFANHGKLSLRLGLYRTTRPLSSRCPGKVYKNIIILGSATGEGYLAPPGDIRAFDVVTGKLVWVFHTIPRPGEFGYNTWPKEAYTYMGGVDAWGELTVDVKHGIVFVPLASGKYELYGGDRPGANLYADSLVALDANTGKKLWYFQDVHHDLWDYDLNAAPQLVRVRHNGKMIDAVAVASKNGFLWVFNEFTGKELWPVVERPVPQSHVPDEHSWPTQPFPTAPPPFARQGWKPSYLFTGFMRPSQIAWWKNRVSKAQYGFYMPSSINRETISLPSVNGGALFFGTASDPTNGTVYVVNRNVPSILKLEPSGHSTAANAGGLVPSAPPSAVRRRRGLPTVPEMGRAIYEQNCQECHGVDLKGTRGPAIDNAVSTLGEAATRAFIKTGGGIMPSFAKMPAQPMNELLAFLKQPSLAPPGSAPSARMQAIFKLFSAPPYPPDVTPPPSRYKTGYGNEPFIIIPPWSTLTAYNLNTGKIKWQVPYGGLPEAPPGYKHDGNVFPKSGPVVTAGGLIFFAGNDSTLYALDSATGKVIASIPLPNGSQGVPAVYEAHGREYVLVAVCGGATPYPKDAYLPPGGTFPADSWSGYVALALPSRGKN